MDRMSVPEADDGGSNPPRGTKKRHHPLMPITLSSLLSVIALASRAQVFMNLLASPTVFRGGIPAILQI